MPPRSPFHAADDLLVPAYFSTGADAAALEAWKREHPDWFIAGYWTPGSVRGAAHGKQEARRLPGEGPIAGGSLLDPETISLADFQAVARAARAGARADPAILPIQARPPGRRAARGGPLRSPVEELRESRFHTAIRKIRELEPNNHHAAYLRDPAQPIPEEQVRILEREAEAAQARADAADPATPAQRLRLRRELERAGEIREGDGKEAHHIVPQGGRMNGDRDPTAAQDILRRNGVDLDQAENGVALSAQFHRHIHTARYYDYVRRELYDAQSNAEVQSRLHLMARRLRIADQVFQQTGKVPEWVGDR